MYGLFFRRPRCFLQGISLGAVVALTLADHYDRDVGFTYNRKEAKDHGEKGHLVGSDLKVCVRNKFTQLLLVYEVCMGL